MSGILGNVMASASASKEARKLNSSNSDDVERVFVSRSKWTQTDGDQRRVLAGLRALDRLIVSLQEHRQDEVEILRSACRVLTEDAGYVGALAVSLEDENNLSLRAAALQLPADVDGTLLLQPLNELLQSDRPLVQFDRSRQSYHLAARALTGSGEPVESEDAHDMFGPLLNEEEARQAARLARIERGLALPITTHDETWGSLLIMTDHDQFAAWERHLLSSLAQQVALGMHNARLYRRVEEQRQVAQTFARMAFSASAYLHTLRNQIGSFRTYLGLVQLLPQMPPEQQQEVINSSHKAYQGLNQAVEILDHLHEPWQQQPDTATDVNDCLTVALLKLFPKLDSERPAEPYTDHRGITVHRALAPSLPTIQTSSDMLTEVFRITIRNAIDAIQEREEGPGTLWVQSESDDNTICVTIRDNGVGIAPADREHIFELGWSTKKGEGMGFGLFWAKNFVEGLGGRIEVHSVPQQGATFRFVLPLDG